MRLTPLIKYVAQGDKTGLSDQHDWMGLKGLKMEEKLTLTPNLPIRFSPTL